MELMADASKNKTNKIGIPDIMFRFRDCIVMIEVKHGTGKQVEWDWNQHPCRDDILVFDLDKDTVKKNAENGALHYLQHALNHREELLAEGIDIVLSVGASFDDDGGFIATPYYADATTGRIQRLHQFSRAFYFQPEVLEHNIEYMRRRLRSGERDEGAWSDIRHHLDTMGIQPYGRNAVPIMCLLWAMSYPRFIGSRLDRSNTFDTVLDYCQDMEDHFAKDEYKGIIGSFRTGGENADLIPKLDLAGIERFIESETHITPVRLLEDHNPDLQFDGGLRPREDDGLRTVRNGFRGHSGCRWPVRTGRNGRPIGPETA